MSASAPALVDTRSRLIIIENVLDKAGVQALRDRLDPADWVDGKASAGSVSQAVKRNRQLDQNSDTAITLGNHIVGILGRHPTFISAALPQKIYPPMFNNYAGGGTYGAHIDSAIMHVDRANMTVRTDLSATLFLTEPEDYDGGELVIETSYGAQPVKLAAGDLVLYPATSLHQVTPVTRGARISSFFWIQSMVQDGARREMLYDLDRTIQQLRQDHDDNDPRLNSLTGIYHNLMRQWAVV